MGIEFQITAFQAVMADLFDGDTIHHALGIPCFTRTTRANTEDLIKSQEVGKRTFRWRWLIIDEMSMVSARLLADVDMKLRHLVKSKGAFKHNAQGYIRSFGGLNVFMAGDVWQLPPPDGGFLGDIPHEYIARSRRYVPSACIAHGQSLVWSPPDTGIQGVTEFVQCERCDDPWLKEVQDGSRHGRLSEESHKLLHGEKRCFQVVT